MATFGTAAAWQCFYWRQLRSVSLTKIKQIQINILLGVLCSWKIMCDFFLQQNSSLLAGLNKTEEGQNIFHCIQHDLATGSQIKCILRPGGKLYSPEIVQRKFKTHGYSPWFCTGHYWPLRGHGLQSRHPTDTVESNSSTETRLRCQCYENSQLSSFTDLFFNDNLQRGH